MNAIEYRSSATDNPKWLAEQHDYCQEYARENGMTIVADHIDIGRNRVGLRQVLDSAGQDGASAVIVSDLARLSREVIGYLGVLRRFREAGLMVHVAKKRRENAMDSLFLALDQAYAEAEELPTDLLFEGEPDD